MSTEKPRCGLVDAGTGESGEELLQYQVVPNFRIRTIPVLGTTPSAFGMAAAGFVLCALAEQPIDPRPLFRLPERSIQTQYNRLESRLGREPGVDLAEVEVLVREIWRGESARGTEPSPLRGVSKSIGHLHLTSAYIGLSRSLALSLSRSLALSLSRSLTHSLARQFGTRPTARSSITSSFSPGPRPTRTMPSSHLPAASRP